MPSKPLRLCSYPGCAELVPYGRCEKHTVKRDDKEYDRRRGTASSRGYDIQWQRFRKVYLARHPLCMRCQETDRIEPATLIHHIIPLKAGGHKYDDGNLMPLCFDCHEVVEGRQRKG